MEIRNLGRSGLKVSTLCLGAMTFGEADESSMMHGIGANEATSFKLLDHALANGINFVDTANVYGQDGLSERVLGAWLEQSGKRDEVVLATKCRFRMQKHANGTGASRRQIIKACEDSLQRLATDRIDLYQIHMQDIDTPEEETLRALDDLVHQGKILYIGCSNYAAYRLVHSHHISEREGLGRYVSLQAQYSLIERSLEREHVPACRDFGLGILPWSPLAGGFLTGKYERGKPATGGSRMESQKFAWWWKQIDNERSWRIMDALRAVAKELDSTPARVAIAWLIKKPEVTSVIFGARTIEQLDDNLAAADLKLPEAQFDQLEKASAIELGYPYDFIRNVQGRW